MTIWATRHAEAQRAVELHRANPDWTFGQIATALAREGFTTNTGQPYETTSVILLLMLGEHGFPSWLKR